MRTEFNPTVQLFGSVAVSVGTAGRELLAGKPAGVLAILALHAGRVVSTETLVDALWGERPPVSARGIVHTYISGLRHLLAHLGPSAPAVGTVPGGYRLMVAPSQVDVLHFLTLATSAEATVEELEASLQWSAEPLLIGADTSFVEPWQRRVDAARASVQDRVWAARVKGDDPAVVVPALQLAVRQHPLREDTVLLLATALTAAGRQEEALAAIDGYRVRLGEELGLDPSPRVGEVRQQLLAGPRTAQGGAGKHERPGQQERPGEQERPEDDRAQLREPERPQSSAAEPHLLRRWLLAGTAAMCVVILTAAVGHLVRWPSIGDRGAEVTDEGPALLLLDVTSGEIQHRVALSVQPAEVEASGNLVWVRSELDRVVAVVDLDDSYRQRVVGLPEPPTALAATRRSAAVGLGYSGNMLTVTEQGSGVPEAVLPNTAGRLTLASHGEEIWAATLDGRIRAVSEPSEAALILRVQGAPRRMAVDSTRVWILTFDKSSLVAVDKADGTQVASPLRGEPVDLAVHDGDAWAVTSGDDRLWRASAVGGRVIATRPLPGQPAGIVAASDRVWVAVRQPATLLSYDRTSLDLIESIHLPQDPAGLTTTSGLVIIAVH